MTKEERLEKNRQWKKAHPEKVREYNQRWRDKQDPNWLANYDREYHQKYKKEKPEKLREIRKRWRDDNPDKIRAFARKPKAKFASTKTNAKARNIEFTLTFEEFDLLLSEQTCHYCKGILGKLSPTGSSLDRIDNNKGYHSGNCVACCQTCNTLKGNILSYDEAIAAINVITTMRKKDNNE